MGGRPEGKIMDNQARVTLAKIEQENLTGQETWKTKRLLSVNGNNVKLRVMCEAEARDDAGGERR